MARLLHGTIGGYTNHHCRCAKCRRAWTDYNQERRWERREGYRLLSIPHGTYTGYHDYKCRCWPCKKAGKAFNHAQYEKRKASA